MSAGSVRAGGAYVEISGNTTKLVRALDVAQARVQAFSKVAISVGKTMMMGGGILAAPLLAGVKVAADFEQSMIEVAKVTDQVTAARLSGEIRELAKSSILSHAALATLAADAARFGIRGVKDIMSFTKTVAKMGVATELSAEQAGTAIAKLMNQMHIPVNEAENLGSAINELSNNFATSADEIVNAMLRSSAQLSQMGMSAQEIVALSASMNAVSESAERAGTRLRALGMALTDPNAIIKIADALGMTVDTFKAMVKNAPLDTIQYLAKVIKAGGKEAEALNGVLDRTSRTALAALGSAVEETTRAVNMSNKAYAKATSLQKEYDAATSTFWANLSNLKNKLVDVGITIGNELLPAFKRYAASLQNLTKLGASWVSANKEIITSVTELSTKLLAAGAAFIAFGIAGKGVAVLLGAGGMLVGGISTVISKLTIFNALLKTISLTSFGAFINYVQIASRALYAYATAQGVVTAAMIKGKIALAATIVQSSLLAGGGGILGTLTALLKGVALATYTLVGPLVILAATLAAVSYAGYKAWKWFSDSAAIKKATQDTASLTKQIGKMNDELRRTSRKQGTGMHFTSAAAIKEVDREIAVYKKAGKTSTEIKEIINQNIIALQKQRKWAWGENNAMSERTLEGKRKEAKLLLEVYRSALNTELEDKAIVEQKKLALIKETTEKEKKLRENLIKDLLCLEINALDQKQAFEERKTSDAEQKKFQSMIGRDPGQALKWTTDQLSESISNLQSAREQLTKTIEDAKKAPSEQATKDVQAAIAAVDKLQSRYFELKQRTESSGQAVYAKAKESVEDFFSNIYTKMEKALKSEAKTKAKAKKDEEARIQPITQAVSTFSAREATGGFGGTSMNALVKTNNDQLSALKLIATNTKKMAASSNTMTLAD